jgi:heme exporter protein B
MSDQPVQTSASDSPSLARLERGPGGEVKTKTKRARRSPVTPYLRAVGAIAWKDLRAEIRSRELINSMILFTVMVVMVFSLALELDASTRESVVAGVLWVTVVFAGMLGLGRSLASEKDRGSLDALLLAPIDRSALFFGKMIGNLLFVLVITLVLLVLLTVMFNITLIKPLLLAFVVLGSLGFTTVGTLIASMSVHARARETLLPILLLPVVLPVLISAVRGSNAILTDLPSEDWLPWLQLLAVTDVMFLAGAYALFDFVVEE